MKSTGGSWKPDAIAFAGITIVKFAGLLWVLHAGFTHISDDDYSRTVIAQSFAHSPKLDPSGTSWLPFPFWITGAAMRLFSRDMAVARGVVFALSLFGSWRIFQNCLRLGYSRSMALVGTLFGIAVPWVMFTSATSAPEGFVGAWIVAALLSLGSPSTSAVDALMLCGASLSRYEAWPVCAAFGIVLLVRAKAFRERIVLPVLANVGIVAWMVWNAFAHHDALHFFRRVANYHAAHTSESSGVLAYPSALVSALPGAMVLLALAIGVLSWKRVGRQFIPLALGLVALLAFLIVGESSGGAPTHHPERALLAIAIAAGPVFVYATSQIGGRARLAFATIGGIAYAAFTIVGVANAPGRTPDESRDKAYARGVALRAHPDVIVHPCRFEHFAFIAGTTAPERVITGDKAPEQSPLSECPVVQSKE